MEGEQHHIDKAACLANMFYFFLNAAKSCLFPFLALYLGRIGLSATQVGLVLGVQALVSMFTMPQWTSCAKFLNKKRLLLVFSVLTLILSYLSLSVLPPGVDNICSAGPPQNHTYTLSTTVTNVNESEAPQRGNISDVDLDVSTVVSNVSSTVVMPEMTTVTYDTTKHNSSTFPHDSLTTLSPIYEEMLELDEQDIASFEDLGLSRSQVEQMSTDELIAFLESTIQQEQNAGPSTAATKVHRTHVHDNMMETAGRPKRDVMYNYMDQLSQTVAKWQGTNSDKQYHTFLFVMLLLTISALFASPLEKLADDCWFEYLDVLDKLEKYGHHRAWGCVGAAITPAAVAFLVFKSDCLLGDVVYHMVIHFYGFIMLLVIVLCLSCYFPISHHKRTAKRSQMFKGLRLLCGDLHALSLTVSMFLYGMVYAAIFNFLFWRMSELDPSELPMGASVAVGALSEVILTAVYSSCGQCAKSISQSASVFVAFLCLGLRLLFYSYMFDPWLVVAGESFHGCSNMLLQLTMENYPDFRLSIVAMDRSALTVLRAISHGLGYGVGCMLSGMLFDLVGFQLLYQGAAALCGFWCFVFLMISVCCKKKERILYTKLLSSDDTDSGDGDNNSMYEEDWLDVALERNS